MQYSKPEPNLEPCWVVNRVLEPKAEYFRGKYSRILALCSAMTAGRRDNCWKLSCESLNYMHDLT